MQVVLFISIAAAELTSSIALFRMDPMSPVCAGYPSIWAYAAGHFVATVLILLVIAFGWWLGGNQAAWDAICRTRQRNRVLIQGGLIGVGIDLISSVLSYFIQNMSDGPHVALQGSTPLWLLLRAGLWSGAYYAAGGVFLWLLGLRIRSRRLSHASSR
jgi:hypothetical protein